MIANYVRNGNGLAIWADNDPLYADANLLAGALIGSNFSGNRDADRIMEPGPEAKPGCFVEHPLTQGVNNLYEGITICTITPGPGVTILGQSHDGQLCVGCYEDDSQRIVLDTGFTKLYNGYFHKSAGLGRYLSNIAFWLARGSRGVEYQLLSPGREEIATIRKGEHSKAYQFTVAQPTAVTCILQWEGAATLGLSVYEPGGSPAGRDVASGSPLRMNIQAGATGTWSAHVEGVEVPSTPIPYVLTLIHETAPRTESVTEGRIVMPFYLICDVSSAASATIGGLNAALRQIQRTLAQDPNLNATAMLSVIAFHDKAGTVVPLAAPATITMPTLSAGGGTSHSAAIREYHRAFEQDRSRLKAAGARVVRPCVFFLAQGEPTDADHGYTFRSVLGYDPATKHGNQAYPNLVAIGLLGTSPQTLAALAYPDFGDLNRRGRWFMAEPITFTAETLSSMADAICGAMADAAVTAAQGAPLFVPPASIPGTRGGLAGRDA